MSFRALQMLSGYRANVVEQDDPILRLMEVVRVNGFDFDVLLASTAVHYAVRRQKTPSLVIGTWRRCHSPSAASAIESLIAKDASIYVIGDDLASRGIERNQVLDGVHVVPRYGVPTLFERYDYVFRW